MLCFFALIERSNPTSARHAWPSLVCIIVPFLRIACAFTSAVRVSFLWLPDCKPSLRALAHGNLRRRQKVLPTRSNGWPTCASAFVIAISRCVLSASFSAVLGSYFLSRSWGVAIGLLVLTTSPLVNCSAAHVCISQQVLKELGLLLREYEDEILQMNDFQASSPWHVLVTWVACYFAVPTAFHQEFALVAVPQPLSC